MPQPHRQPVAKAHTLLNVATKRSVHDETCSIEVVPGKASVDLETGVDPINWGSKSAATLDMDPLSTIPLTLLDPNLNGSVAVCRLRHSTNM